MQAWCKVSIHILHYVEGYQLISIFLSIQKGLQMNIEKEVTYTANIERYRLELNCAKDTYSFWAYTESNSIECSFTDITRDELTDIITFLQKGINNEN